MTTKLLLVDDEPLLTEELQEALEFEGFVVDTANSVPTAIDAFARTHYNCVVTDLKMPHQGGLDLIRSLNDAGDPPVIFVLSGHGAETSRAEAMSLGATECFAKPVDPDVLSDHIRTACG